MALQCVRGPHPPAKRINTIDTHTRNRPDQATHPKGTHLARLLTESQVSSSADG